MSRALQKLIHAGCRELGLDTDTRRELQLVATGRASMADMTEADLRKLLDALKARGFKADFKGASTGRKRYAPAPREDLRYVHVLWRLLTEAGEIKRPGRAGLNAFIRARFEAGWGSVPIDIDTMTDAAQINAVVRALKDMCRRANVSYER